MLILISGSSGAGKNTIIDHLMQRNDNIRLLQSCTTRKRRKNEKENAYIYLSKEEFDEKLKNGEIFENEEIHQNFYGILNSSLQEVLKEASKNIHYIKDVGVLGQINLSRELKKKKIPVLTIFIQVPRAQLIERLKNRGEKNIDLRLSRMEFETGYIDNFDEIVKNVDLEKTLTRIEKIINKYRLTMKKTM